MTDALEAHAALEARCRDLVTGVDLSQASTTDDLAAAVATYLQTTIHLRPFPRSAVPDLSGGCLVVGQDVVIAYPDGADPWYVQVTVGHELGHLLCGHLTGLPTPRPGGDQARIPRDPDTQDPGSHAPDSTGAQVPGAQDDDLLAVLLPDLLAAHQTWQLFRCASRTPAERDAEMVGSLLVAQMEYHRTPRSPEASRLTGLVSRRPGRLR